MHGPLHGPLRRAIQLLEVNKLDATKAVAAGVLALGSSIALAAVSAWLIARASQMPPVMYLTMATVAVRTFGITRGIFRYIERLASHRVALTGMAQLRTAIYSGLARGNVSSVASLKRGDLLARVSADVDAVGDLVVKGLLPGAVAAVLSAATVLFVGIFHVPSAITLGIGILLAGALAPWLTARAARKTEGRTAAARSDLSVLAHELVADASELQVRGDLPAKFAQLENTEREIFAAADDRAKMEGWAQSVSNFALVFAAFAAAVVGSFSVVDGTLSPVMFAVVVLTPLAVFEVLQGLPAAAIQVHTSRQAAIRIMALLDDAATPDADPDQPAIGPSSALTGIEKPGAALPSRASVLASDQTQVGTLHAQSVSCGWPPRHGAAAAEPVLTELDLLITPGRSIALVGASGTGKTTTLMTLAGLLPARAGKVTLRGPEFNGTELDGIDLSGPESSGPESSGTELDGTELDGPEFSGTGLGGTDLRDLDLHTITESVVFTAEDAHIFDTTVLENLRVARGSVTEAEATAALAQAGLGDWLAALPEGLSTVLGTNAATISGGERRRLLLARALCSRARVLLLDEPAEHLDPLTADKLLTDLLTAAHGDTERAMVIATHRVTAMAAADEVLMLGAGKIVARGTHAYLLTHNEQYRAAYDSQLSGTLPVTQTPRSHLDAI